MTEPIIASCGDCDCVHNMIDENDCRLDEIELDINGVCKSRKLNEDLDSD